MKYGNTIVSSSDKPDLQFLAGYCASENMQQNGKVRRHNIPKRKFNAHEFTCIDLSKSFGFLCKITLLNAGKFETRILKDLIRDILTRQSFLNSNCNSNLSNYRLCFDIVCGYPLIQMKNCAEQYWKSVFTMCIECYLVKSDQEKTKTFFFFLRSFFFFSFENNSTHLNFCETQKLLLCDGHKRHIFQLCRWTDTSKIRFA